MLAKISLKYRIAAVIFALEAVMMAAVFSLTMSELQSAKSHYFSKKSQAMLTLVSELSRFALFSAEYDDLQPYVESLKEDPEIIEALVIDRFQRIVAASNTSLVGQSAPTFDSSRNSSWRVSKLENVAGPLGYVAVNFSFHELSQANRKAVIKGIWIALTGMVLIAVVGFITGFLLTRRLALLTKAARSMAEGDLSVKVNVKGSDEVAELGHSFELMSRKIKSYIQDLQARETQLKQAHDELEQRVQARTAELARANGELERLALYDDLTGLPNRAMLMKQLHQHTLNINTDALSMLMMDLDYFKQVNDSLGHIIGDELLVQVGRRISGILREQDVVARLGGDEFSFLLPGTGVNRATQVAKRILKVLEPPFVIAGHKLSIAASVGIAAFPQHGNNANELMQHADIAMYLAKRGKKGYNVYNDGQQVIDTGNLSLVSDLRQAIECDELRLVFQPKVNLHSGKTTAVEALVRWTKNGTVVSPDKFVPFAEQTGLIYPLTEWVLTNALKQCSKWHRKGIPVRMSVNISTRNLQDKHFAKLLVRLLDRYGIEPGHLVLEITETDVMTDPMGALAVLNHLKHIGVGLSVDDFGTGYSSLAHLIKLPVDEIKVDRSFIKGMGDGNKENYAIVHSIVDLAKNLNVSVVAEGVEDMGTLQLLEQLGCDYIQGYFLAQPMSADVFTQWVNTPNLMQHYYRNRKQATPAQCDS